MTTFLDGPARGVTLMLRSAPPFLRVVRDPAGGWDALDQPGDAPAADESIAAYRRAGEVGALHIDFARGRGRDRSAWFVVAEYHLVVLQPDAEVLRDGARWEAWCAAAEWAEHAEDLERAGIAEHGGG